MCYKLYETNFNLYYFSSWSQEEMDTLYWYYVQSKKNNDIVGKIVKLFSNNGNKLKTRISIIQQLLQQVRKFANLIL